MALIEVRNLVKKFEDNTALNGVLTSATFADI